MSDNGGGRKRRGGGAGGDGGRKKRGHYLQSSGHGKPSEKAMPLGSPGMLVTCEAGREFKAAEEMVRLLEESFERLGRDHVGRVGSEQQQPPADTAAAAAAAAAAGGGDSSAAAAGGGSAKPRSIAEELAAEVAGLKKERSHRFRRHNTDVRGTVFMEFPKDADTPSPEDVAFEIASHVRATRSLPARFVLRLLPVSLSCFASNEAVATLAPQLAARFFPAGEEAAPDGQAGFAVEFEHRSCDKVKRGDAVNALAQAVPQPPYKVNLSAPDRTILVQVVRNVVGMSVVRDFRGLAKYNLRRLTEEDEEGGAEEQGGAKAGGGDGEKKQEQQQQQPAEEAGKEGGGAAETVPADAAPAAEAAPAAAEAAAA